MKILIVNSNYYKIISKNLLINAKKKLLWAKYSIKSIDVPGVFEVPIVIRRNITKYDAFVVLGCVIKGETPHFDIISNTSSQALMDITLKSMVPIANGILATNNLEQAEERASPTCLNKGKEITQSLLEMMEI